MGGLASFLGSGHIVGLGRAAEANRIREENLASEQQHNSAEALAKIISTMPDEAKDAMYPHLLNLYSNKYMKAKDVQKEFSNATTEGMAAYHAAHTPQNQANQNTAALANATGPISPPTDPSANTTPSASAAPTPFDSGLPGMPSPTPTPSTTSSDSGMPGMMSAPTAPVTPPAPPFAASGSSDSSGVTGAGTGTGTADNSNNPSTSTSPAPSQTAAGDVSQGISALIGSNGNGTDMIGSGNPSTPLPTPTSNIVGSSIAPPTPPVPYAPPSSTGSMNMGSMGVSSPGSSSQPVSNSLSALRYQQDEDRKIADLVRTEQAQMGTTIPVEAGIIGDKAVNMPVGLMKGYAPAMLRANAHIVTTGMETKSAETIASEKNATALTEIEDKITSAEKEGNLQRINQLKIARAGMQFRAALVGNEHDFEMKKIDYQDAMKQAHGPLDPDAQKDVDANVPLLSTIKMASDIIHNEDTGSIAGMITGSGLGLKAQMFADLPTPDQQQLQYALKRAANLAVIANAKGRSTKINVGLVQAWAADTNQPLDVIQTRLNAMTGMILSTTAGRVRSMDGNPIQQQRYLSYYSDLGITPDVLSKYSDAGSNYKKAATSTSALGNPVAPPSPPQSTGSVKPPAKSSIPPFTKGEKLTKGDIRIMPNGRPAIFTGTGFHNDD